MVDWLGGLMMSKIAFLGLGQMGTPMAARLLQAGHHVTVWDRTPARATPLLMARPKAAQTIKAYRFIATPLTDCPETARKIVRGSWCPFPENTASILATGRVKRDAAFSWLERRIRHF